MRPHADVLVKILMLGDAPNEIQILDTGVNNNDLLWLAMNGLVKKVGTEQVRLPRFGFTFVQMYEVTDKGLRYLK